MNREEKLIDEWREEAIQRFGKDPMKWAFVCPACGHVATGEDFAKFGGHPEQAAVECIGRINGKGCTPDPGTLAPDGCNWCAYGLFGTMEKGRYIITGMGSRIEVFQFASSSDRE